MFRLAVLLKDGQIDPRKAAMVARAPDHILHIERGTVCQEGQPGARAYHSGHPGNSAADQLLGLYPDKWGRGRKQFGAELPTQRSFHGEDMVAEETHQAHQEESCNKAVVRPGNMTRLLSRNPGRMRARGFDGNLRARV